MKNSIIIAVIAFVAIFSTNNANANTYAPTTPVLSPNAITITINIKFGRKSQVCTGTGICSIKISVEMAAPSNDGASGTAEDKDGKLVVTLKKSSMTREALAKYFANGKFVVEEDFEVAQDIKSPRDAASGLATGKRQHKPYIISKGVYNVQDNGSTLTIVF